MDKCQSEGQRSNCTPCPVGQYTEELNFSNNCFRCRQCKCNDFTFFLKSHFYFLNLPMLHEVIVSVSLSSTFSTAKKHEIMVSKCEPHRNTICRCEKGYYKKVIDSETYECLKCKQCKPDENLKQPCKS